MLYQEIPSGYRQQSEDRCSHVLSLAHEAADDVTAVAVALMNADKIAESRLALCLSDDGIEALEELRGELDDLIGRLLAKAEQLRQYEKTGTPDGAARATGRPRSFWKAPLWPTRSDMVSRFRDPIPLTLQRH